MAPSKKGQKFRQVNSQVPDDVNRAYGQIESGESSRKNMYKNGHGNKSATQQQGIRSFLINATEKSRKRYDEGRNLTEIDESQINTTTNNENDNCIQKLNEDISKLTKEYEELTKGDKFDLKTIFLKMNQLIKAMNDRHDFVFKHLTINQGKSTDFVISELNDFRMQIDSMKTKQQNELESIKVVDDCRNDLRKFWLRFRYRGEAQQIRQNGNYPLQIKKILGNMGIKFDLGILPIETAFFHDRKFGRDDMPEIALCCIFTNSTIAKRVKAEIAKFNRKLEEEQKHHMIRYFTSVNWSESVWNIMRICIELKNFNLINNVFATNEGIKVQYNSHIDASEEINQDPNDTVITPPQQIRTVTTKINNAVMLDNLRMTVKDFNFQIPFDQVYNPQYFRLSLDDRRKIREAPMINSSEPNDEIMLDASDTSFINN